MPRFVECIEALRLYLMKVNIHQSGAKIFVLGTARLWRNLRLLHCSAVTCVLLINGNFETHSFGAEIPTAHVPFASDEADEETGDKPVKPSRSQGVSGDPSEEAMVLLKTRCVRCHNTEKKKAGLALVTSETLRTGSDNGPVIVPEAADDSMLIQVLEPDSDPHMPPKEQLEDDEINALKNWVNQGGEWNDEAFQNAVVSSIIDSSNFRPLPKSYKPVLSLALTQDNKWLAVGRGNRIDVYECGETNHVISRHLEGHRDAVQSLTWSADGQWLASGGFRSIRLWEVESFSTAIEITNLVGRITALEFTPDSALLIAADGIETQSGVIRVFNVGESESKRSWTAHDDTILALKASPDGSMLASASVDKLVKLWEIEGFNEAATLEGHNGNVIALRFNSSGTQLATGGGDADVKIWDVEAQNQLATITGHPASVTDLVWTIDDKKILTACEDGKTRICSESKKRPEKTLGSAQDVLYRLAISSDGNRRYGGCFDGLVYVWDTKGKLVEELEVLPNNNQPTSGGTSKLH